MVKHCFALLWTRLRTIFVTMPVSLFIKQGWASGKKKKKRAQVEPTVTTCKRRMINVQCVSLKMSAVLGDSTRGLVFQHKVRFWAARLLVIIYCVAHTFLMSTSLISQFDVSVCSVSGASCMSTMVTASHSWETVQRDRKLSEVLSPNLHIVIFFGSLFCTAKIPPYSTMSHPVLPYC